MPDLNQVCDDLNKSFVEFKEVNEKALAEVKKSIDGKASAETEAKLDKVNAHISDLEEKFEALAVEQKRKTRLSSDEKAAKIERAKDFESKAVGSFFRRAAQVDLSTIFSDELANVQDEAERKDLQINVDSNGGYLLRSEFGGVVNGRLFETSNLRPFANVVSTTTQEYQIVIDDDEAGAGWTGETATRAATDTPDVKRITLQAHEMYAKPRATQTLIDDASVNAEAWLVDKIADRMGRLENTAFVTGDGVGKPRGFTTYDATSVAGAYEFGKIEQINSGSASAITANGILSLVYSLKDGYLPNARFAMKRSTREDVRKLVQTSTNNYLWQPGLTAGEPPSLAGYPIISMEDMPTVEASALPIAFADWKRAYTIVDRMGLRILRDPFSDKPFVQFYSTRRVGGGVTNFDAIKLMKIAN